MSFDKVGAYGKTINEVREEMNLPKLDENGNYLLDKEIVVGETVVPEGTALQAIPMLCEVLALQNNSKLAQKVITKSSASEFTEQPIETNMQQEKPITRESIERAVNALTGYGYITNKEAKKVSVSRIITEADLIGPDKSLPYILTNRPGFRVESWQKGPMVCNQCGNELPLNESWLFAGRRFCYEHYLVVKDYCDRNEITETDLRYKGEY